jgi:hypothetical protein
MAKLLTFSGESAAIEQFIAFSNNGWFGIALG